jgi:hypothetical protein
MEPKLFMILVGCKPQGRHIQQHDLFFTIANSIEETRTAVLDFWPEAKGRVHMDGWREVTHVDGYNIKVIPKEDLQPSGKKLFFINLGGYRPGEFDEPHYRLLIVANDLATAGKIAKQAAFYKHTGFSGAPSHIDDKYGIDVDDAFEVSDILGAGLKQNYTLQISEAQEHLENELHLGYMPLYKK